MVGNDFFHAFIIECMGYKVTNEFVLGCSTAIYKNMICVGHQLKCSKRPTMIWLVKKKCVGCLENLTVFWVNTLSNMCVFIMLFLVCFLSLFLSLSCCPVLFQSGFVIV